FEGVTSFDRVSTTPEPNGAFEFAFSAAPSRTYFVSVEYQGARYSDSRETGTVDQSVFLEVFDSTDDPSVLSFESYSVIVTGALPSEGFLEILERAVIRNTSDFTLVPDPQAENPAMLSFLRFGLPPGFYNLNVRSNLVGGDVLEVDRGFALTTPIIPSRDEPHQVEFDYRLNYDESTLDLSRTMRFGAGSFRFVVPDDTARPAAPQLEDLGVADLSGRLLRLLESQDIAEGQVIELTVSGLPLPSFWSRASDELSNWYFRYAVPGFIGVALALLVGLVIRKRRVTVDVSPESDLPAQRGALLLKVEELEAARKAGALSERGYASRRGELKRALMDLELEQRLRSGPPSS
ncbi:MAG: hypothetical protein V3S98_09250, partial [Dehalococcoidia bacterium]